MGSIDEVAILVVDDEVELRKAIVFDFKRKGFKTFEATSGTEAFELVKNNDIRLVLSDVRMPNGDGVELLAKIKAFNPDLPVILITGFADLSVDDAYDQGANAVFSKPFDRKALINTVIRAITSSTSNCVRKYEREPADFAIEVKISENSTEFTGTVLNLGRGGFFLKADQLPNVNDRLTFILHTEEGTFGTVKGSGIVRWVRNEADDGYDRGCGVEFESFDDHGRAKIIELVNKLKTRAYIPKGLEKGDK